MIQVVKIQPSKILEKRGVSDIGLRSLKDVGGLTLGMGEMKDSFQAEGNVPEDRDVLKMCVSGCDSSNANSFTSRAGNSFGVVEMLQRMLLSFLWMSDRLMTGGAAFAGRYAGNSSRLRAGS